ncbi:MAG: sigma-54 dependent transcriptional regulator [Myxococcales bacterium]|nr:sigma-54 dependent transcriptional regulator [Myxococcales bacterium]
MELGATQTILVVDDEANIRKVLSALLGREGYKVLTASDGEGAWELLDSARVDVVLTDLRMPGVDGMQLLKRVIKRYRGLPVVMLTAHGTVDTAVDAMKLGAFDYLTKPFDKEELQASIRKAAAHARVRDAEPGVRHGGHGSRYGIVGRSPALDEVFRTIQKVAASPTTVLITGESGTGKELIADAIHQESPRTNKPLIKINCAAIPRDLIESELFGYEKGAFTGAVTSKPGRFELAHEGTLFLDEINSIPLEMQVKLLRALQSGTFERVGGVSTTQVNVRLITASNRDLTGEVAGGRFREDLFYRLNVVHIDLPPLRERRDDLPLLIERFVEKFNNRLGKQVVGLTNQAFQRLMIYHWPGNIRELENVIERAILFAEGDKIAEDELPNVLRDLQLSPISDTREQPKPEPYVLVENIALSSSTVSEPVGPLKEIIRRHTYSLERDLIGRALKETRGNVTKAARRLEISRKSLQNKMKDLGLRSEDTDDEDVPSR